MSQDSFWAEAVLVLVMILLNGFFAGSEIAVVSSRRSELNRLAKQGKRGASIVARWLKEPERFLATVQIGITVVGVLASAVGGAAAIEFLKPRLEKIEAIAPWAETAAMGIVVAAITYLSLVFGELVPKSLALAHRERLASKVALPIYWLSKAARPLVYFLTLSTRLAIRLFGQKEIPRELFVSEEEIRFLIKEGGSQGVFDQTEQQLIPKVFEFADITVKALMVPREKVVSVDVATPTGTLLRKVAEEGYSRLPVCQGSLDHIVGILHMKDLIHALTLGKLVVIQDLVRPAVFVGENTPAKELLALFQKRRLHMAVLQDNNGKTTGLVTLEDLIERIVGDIKDEQDQG